MRSNGRELHSPCNIQGCQTKNKSYFELSICIPIKHRCVAHFDGSNDIQQLVRCFSQTALEVFEFLFFPFYLELETALCVLCFFAPLREIKPLLRCSFAFSA